MQTNSQYKRLIAAGLLLCTVTACVVDAELLNSERISRKFGSYGIEVIENEKNTRVSNLYSMESTGRICRTFAVVGLTDNLDPSFAEEHARIQAGGSIGMVFRNNGWLVEKRHLYIGELTIGKQASRLTRLMDIRAPATLAVHIYVLAVSKDGHSRDYAMIAEVHHPEYLTISGLWSIYGSEFSGDKHRRDAQSVLQLVRRKFRDVLHRG